MSSLAALIPPAWRGALQQASESAWFEELDRFVADERAGPLPVYPPQESMLASLDACAPERVGVVVLGQDPYHGAGQANGLAFSVARGVKTPPSLRNMFKERETDVGLAPPEHGDLSNWARQGVLLLNTVLTVREGQANSHRKRGWERFTDSIIDVMNDAPGAGRVFVLWGKPAQRKQSLITDRHRVLTAPHPSPLSAHRGFFGSRPFSNCNAALAELGRDAIDWRLD